MISPALNFLKNKLYMDALKLKEIASSTVRVNGNSITGNQLKPHKSILLKRAAHKMKRSELIAQVS